MIRTIRSKALRKLAEKNDASGLPPPFVPKIKRVLSVLHGADKIEDMNVLGFDNHALSHDHAGFWSITVTRNFRIIYRMEDGDIYDVDYLDYH